MKRTSIIFTGKQQLELVDEPIPSPGPGELLVETTITLISTGTESIVYTRSFEPGTHWDAWVKYPFRTGYCQAGRVAAVGAGVTAWKPGERIATTANHTSHAIVRTDDPGAIRIPDGVADDAAVWMSIGRITQIGVRAAEHRLGDDVVVVGLGVVGQLVVQHVRLAGARRIIAIDLSEERLKIAEQSGATHTVRVPAGEAVAAVRDLTEGRGADVVYDVTGFPKAFADTLKLARNFGTVVLLGDAGAPSQQSLSMDVITRGLRIVGAHGEHCLPQPDVFGHRSRRQMHELFMTYTARGQLRPAELITHRFPPAQAAEAYELLQAQRSRVTGAVFDWTDVA